MEEHSTLPPTTKCPECGAVLSQNAENCWLCGWKCGDRLSSDAVGVRHGADWTFNLNTLFLWMALIAVVVWIAKSYGVYGIGAGILSFCAALNTIAVAGYRRRNSGRGLSAVQKIAVFAVSIAICLVIGFVLLASSALALSSGEHAGFGVVVALLGYGLAAFVGCTMYRSLWQKMK
jgi:hypothetical protein